MRPRSSLAWGFLLLVCCGHVASVHASVSTGHNQRVAVEKALLPTPLDKMQLLQLEAKAKTGEPVSTALLAATALIYSANTILAFVRKYKAEQTLGTLESVMEDMQDEKNARCLMFRGLNFQVGAYTYASLVYLAVVDVKMKEERESALASGKSEEKNVEQVSEEGKEKMKEIRRAALEEYNKPAETEEATARAVETALAIKVDELDSGMHEDYDVTTIQNEIELVDSELRRVLANGVEWACKAEDQFQEGSAAIIDKVKADIEALKKKAIKSALSAMTYAMGSVGVGIFGLKAFNIAEIIADVAMEVTMQVTEVLTRISKGEDVATAIMGMMESRIPVLVKLYWFVKKNFSLMDGDLVLAVNTTIQWLLKKAKVYAPLLVKSAFGQAIAALGMVDAIAKLSDNISGLIHDGQMYSALESQMKINLHLMAEQSNLKTCTYVRNVYELAESQNQMLKRHIESAEALGLFDEVRIGDNDEERQLVLHKGMSLYNRLLDVCEHSDTQLCFTAINNQDTRSVLVPYLQEQGKEFYEQMRKVTSRGPISDIHISTNVDDAAALRSMGYQPISTSTLFKDSSKMLWLCRSCSTRAILADSVLLYVEGDSLTDYPKEDELEAACGEKMRHLQLGGKTTLRYCTIDRREAAKVEDKRKKPVVAYDFKIFRELYTSDASRITGWEWRLDYDEVSTGRKQESFAVKMNSWLPNKMYSRIFDPKSFRLSMFMFGDYAAEYSENESMEPYHYQGNPIIAFRRTRGSCIDSLKLRELGWRLEYTYTPENFFKESNFHVDGLNERQSIWSLRSEINNPTEEQAMKEIKKKESLLILHREHDYLYMRTRKYCTLGTVIPTKKFMMSSLQDIPEYEVTRKGQSMEEFHKEMRTLEVAAANFGVRDVQICDHGSLLCQSLEKLPGWVKAGIFPISYQNVVELWFVVRESDVDIDTKITPSPKALTEATIARYREWQCSSLKFLCDASTCDFKTKTAPPMFDPNWREIGSRSARVFAKEWVRTSSWPVFGIDQKKYRAIMLPNIDFIHLFFLNKLKEATGWGIDKEKNVENYNALYKERRQSHRFFAVAWGNGRSSDCIRRTVALDSKTGSISESCDLNSNGFNIYIKSVYVIEIVFDQTGSQGRYETPPLDQIEEADTKGWVLLPNQFKTTEDDNKLWGRTFGGKYGGAIRIWIQIDKEIKKSPIVAHGCRKYDSICGVGVSGPGINRMASVPFESLDSASPLTDEIPLVGSSDDSRSPDAALETDVDMDVEGGGIEDAARRLDRMHDIDRHGDTHPFYSEEYAGEEESLSYKSRSPSRQPWFMRDLPDIPVSMGKDYVPQYRLRYPARDFGL